MSLKIPVPAAERTLQLLELLLANPRGRSLQDLLAHLTISRSTLFSLLQTLKTLDYVHQPQPRGPYLPGPRLLAWTSSWHYNPEDLSVAFRQETDCTPLEETLALVVASPPDILILAQRESGHVVRTGYAPNRPLNPAQCAAGQVLTSTPTEKVRLAGYAWRAHDEFLEIAIPVCPDGVHPSAALLLSAPHHRLALDDLPRHAAPLRQIAARISYRLGAPRYAPFTGPEHPKVEPALPLSADEISAFLRGPWSASLACLRPDGAPHVVPVWHEWDGVSFHVASWGGANWANYLLENPQVSLTVDEPFPPLRRVLAKGLAHPLSGADTHEGAPAILARLSRRFLGQPLDTARTPQPWHAFRIMPELVRGWRGLRLEEP